MSRQKITPGTVGSVSVRPRAVDESGKEIVIPQPVTYDGVEKAYPKGMKAGA